MSCYGDEMSCFGAVVAVSGRLIYTTDPGDSSQETSSIHDKGRVYVFKCNKEGKRGRLMNVIRSPGLPEYDDAFGCSIAVDKHYVDNICVDRVIIGACRTMGRKGLSGAAYVFETVDSGETYTCVKELNLDKLDEDGKCEAQSRSWFGYSVDILSKKIFDMQHQEIGEHIYAIVGAYGKNEDCKWSSGAAYMFNWDVDDDAKCATLCRKFTANVAGETIVMNAFFGYSVALGLLPAQDRVYVAIGAFGADTGGKVYYSIDPCNCDSELLALCSGCTLGYALSASCNYLVVGAPCMGCTGTVFVYDMNHGACVMSPDFQYMLRLRNQTKISQFGRSVSICGNFIVVGANSCEGGLVLVFERGYSKQAIDEFTCLNKFKDTNYWRLEATLRSVEDEEIGFGYSVAVGNCYIIVGSPIAGQSSLFTLRVTRKHYCDRAKPYLVFDPTKFDALLCQECLAPFAPLLDLPCKEDLLGRVLYYPGLPKKCDQV